MKKLIITISIISFTLGFIFFVVKGNLQSKTSQVANNLAAINKGTSSATEEKIIADKIEVVHFHATQQCWSCITVGEYALKTIKEKFPEEFASGKIIYMDINGELKKNQEVVIKYQARGSSLFINAIQKNQDYIVEDVTVWRLVNNESQFVSYFENRLKSLLGK